MVSWEATTEEAGEKRWLCLPSMPVIVGFVLLAYLHLPPIGHRLLLHRRLALPLPVIRVASALSTPLLLVSDRLEPLDRYYGWLGLCGPNRGHQRRTMSSLTSIVGTTGATNTGNSNGSP